MANPITQDGPILTIRVMVSEEISTDQASTGEDREWVFQKPVPTSIKNMEIRYRFIEDDSVYGDEQSFVIPISAN